jgi:SAM-dependent methyltransferase
LRRVLLASLAFATVTLSAAESAREDPLRGSLERIHLECLQAHPPEFLVHLTAGRLRTIRTREDEEYAASLISFRCNLEGEKGDYYPSSLGDLLPALRRVLAPGTRFLDLGSGDGRVVFLANLLGADATGIEYEPRLVEVGRQARGDLANLLGKDRVAFIQGDFFNLPWDAYDVIFYVERSSPERQRLEAKLLAELAPGGRFLISFEERPIAGLHLEGRAGPVTIYRRPR